MSAQGAGPAGGAEPAGSAEVIGERGDVSIVLNGRARAVESGLSVRGLLRRLGLEPGMVVVEHNRRILARAALPETGVEDGDRIELVHFVGGG